MSSISRSQSFSRGGLLLFALLAAVLGIYVVWQGFASSEAPAPNSPTPGKVIYGVTSSGVWGETGLSDVKSLGVGLQRIQFTWTDKATGNDAIFKSAAEQNLKILPLINGSGTYPTDTAKYAKYVADFAARYGKQGTFWKEHTGLNANLAPEYFELWNEPYGSWNGTVNPAGYGQAVKAASTAAKAANPNAKFLLAADWQPREPMQSFIDQLYATTSDINNYFDGVAVHPFPGIGKPDDATYEYGVIKRLTAITQKFKDHNAADKPLWITAIGWSTCPLKPVASGCISEEEQASNVTKLPEVLKKFPNVQALVYYGYRDYEVTKDPAEAQNYYGLARRDGTQKPAWESFKSIVKTGK